MNTKSESGQALIVTIILLAIIIAGFLIVMDGVGHGLSLSIMPDNPTYACIYDGGLSPVQDASFPPEGYHCRPHGESEDTIPTAETKTEKDTDTAVSVSAVVTSENTVTMSAPPAEDKQENNPAGKGNNGHGNNVDGVDVSNPSGHTPHDKMDESAPVDDEKGKP